MTEENSSTVNSQKFKPAVTVIETVVIPLLCLAFFITGFCEFSLFSITNILIVTVLAGLFVYSQAKSFGYLAAKGTAAKFGIIGIVISAVSYLSIFTRS